jgi:hypothetical protein
MKLLLRYGIILLLALVLILFILMIIKEQTGNKLIVIFFSSILMLLLYTLLKFRKILHQQHTEFDSYKLALWVPIGAVCTYYCNHHLQLGAVLSAAIVGFSASFLPNLAPNRMLLKGAPAAVYCGAFIGMSDLKIAQSFSFVLTASFFTAVLLLVSKSILQGVGGKLGTLAFGGVALTYLLFLLLQNL